MTAGTRVRAALAVLVLVALGLTGCVQVPTTGPIEKVAGQAETCQNCVNVEVAPPAPGAEPGQVVEGFLDAMSNYQPNYATARQFLTARAADAWRPEEVSIYEGTTGGQGDGVRLVGEVVGKIGKDRTYTAVRQPLNVSFGLVQDDGEWRIDQPPAGLLVSEFSFTRFYNAYSIYFVGNETSLVPERIYLPALRTPANIASALISALLDGPSAWLAPAVGSAIPTGTSLNVDSVTITNGIAEVALTDPVLALSDAQRGRLAAQIVYTLRQLPAVKGVLITVDQQAFQVPGLADPATQVIAVESLSREIDPVPSASDQLYAVRDGAVYRVTTPETAPGVEPVEGPLGMKDKFAVDSLAVSVNATDLAVVTDRRGQLRRAITATGDVSVVRTGLTSLLRPQFTRYGELWALGQAGGRQRFWVSSVPGGMVTAPVLDGGEIRAFRISPDGTRVALIRQSGSRQQLGLARIVRAGTVTVDEWRTIDIRPADSPALTRIADVAWVDANDLLVLGGSDQDASLVAVRVAADASQVSVEGGRPSWNARALAVLSRPQSFVVVGQEAGQPDRQTWRRNNGQWLPFLADVDTVAYAL